MLVGSVLLSFIRHPLTFPDGRQAFVLEIRDETGVEHHLISLRQPDIYDVEGQPILLAAELSAGSSVVVADDGRMVRAIQVLEHRISNPFRRMIKPNTEPQMGM